MSTLNDTITAHIAALEAQAAQIQATAETQIAALKADIETAKTHLTGLVPWLEQEAATAKTTVEAFFTKLGL